MLFILLQKRKSDPKLGKNMDSNESVHRGIGTQNLYKSFD